MGCTEPPPALPGPSSEKSDSVGPARLHGIPALGSFPAMQSALTILAVFGVLAVLWLLAGALLRAARGGVDHFLARESAAVRARRGDITGMVEAEGWMRQARRDRRAALLMTGLWTALLVAPAFSPVTREIYAAYSILWLVRLAARERRS